jgi:ATP-binding cassette subfamily B protein
MDDHDHADGFDAAAEGVRLDLWKRLFGFALGYRKEIWLLAIGGFVTALMEIAYPLLAKLVVDDVEQNGMDAAFGMWGAIYLGCNVVIAISGATFVWMAGKIDAYASHDIRSEAFANLQRLSFAYFDRRPVGWLMARLTADCRKLTDILAWSMLDFIWGITMMVGIAGAMLVMHWQLALLAMAIMPVVGWVSAKFRKRILTTARLVRQTNSRITGSYNEAIMGMQTSKAFGREEANSREFQGLADTMYRASVRNLVLAAVYLPLVLTLAAVAINLALGAGGMLMYFGFVTVGTVIAFLMYTRYFFEPMQVMGHWFAEMQMAQASAERVLSLIDATPEIEDSPSVRRAIAAQEGAPARRRPPRWSLAARVGSIELVGVGFAYDAAKPVLEDINLRVEADETIAIVGPTGGGKSTLVNVICRFYEPTSGQVLIDGIDYRNRSLHWLQSSLGMVLQNAHVFSGTIMENIRYGRLTATDQEVVWCAKLAGAHDFITDMEKDYDTEVGEGGGRLSAGQKQLVSFARAILAEPQILIMDEATSSVDTQTELKIQEGMKQVFQGRISFVIAHRLSTIRGATRIVVIDDGRIVETGSHAELMAADGHYAALYRQQGLNETQRIWEAVVV